MPAHVSLPAPRSLDSRRTIPGPRDGVPQRDRRAHAQTLRGQLERTIAARSPQAVGIDPELVFKVNASSRLTDSNLSNKGLQLLGESDGWGYFVLPSDGSAATFDMAIRSYLDTEAGRSFFDLVDSIEPYGPSDRLGPGLTEPLAALDYPLLVDIHLWPASSAPQARQRLEKLRAQLAPGQERGADEQPNFLLVRAQLDQDTLSRVLELSVVERVRVPPAPFLSPADWIDAELPPELTRPTPREGVVGIIDDGVRDGHALLAGLVEQFAVPDDRVWAAPTRHGTMVAGLAAYGDFEAALRHGLPLPNPIRVIAARVVEAPAGSDRATYPTGLPEHVVLEQAIRGLAQRGARVINISLSDRDAYSGPHVDQRTEIIDRLSRELDLVIVACSGNLAVLPEAADIHNQHPGHLLAPSSRIAEPSIAAIALTVGSVARAEQGAYSDGDSPPTLRGVATENQVSPFSRSGPGLRTPGSVKPELVHFGGNNVTAPLLSSRRYVDPNPGAGTVSLDVPGPFASGPGTSYSAPRVARVAALVRAEYPNASANLTRALVGLSARVPAPHVPASDVRAEERAAHRRLVGYGIPDEARATESDLNRVAMTYDGAIAVDTSVIHEIPIPPEFATGKAARTISVALAFDPPTRRFRREYLAAHMRFDLYRSIDIDDLAEIIIRQPRRGGLALPNDRRRLQERLVPSSEAVLHSTLQVRRWNAESARSLDPDDGDTYLLVVTHVAEPWAPLAELGYARQRYAIAVELEDRTRVTVDLRQRVVDRIERLRTRV